MQSDRLVTHLQVPEFKTVGLQVVGVRGTGTNFMRVRFATGKVGNKQQLLSEPAPALVQSYTLGDGTRSSTSTGSTTSVYEDLYLCIEPAANGSTGNARYCRPATVGGELVTFVEI